ncbi:glycoside hydrolase family 18 protein [Mucilaginibacter sp. AW1-3]
MFKPLLFLISFCVVISLQSLVINRSIPFKASYPVSDFQVKDTVKKIVDTQKSKAKTSFLSKIAKPLKALIQPFKFTQNEKVRVTKIIHSYIVKDSLAATQQSAIAAKQLKSLTDSMLILQKHLNGVVTQTQLNKLLDSIKRKQQKADSIAAIKPVTPAKPAVDTPANGKSANTAANGGKPGNADDVKAQQAKLNVIRQLYSKGSILITDTSKNKDTAYVKKLTLGHKAQVLGFYADISKNNIKNFNYKLLTTLVYSVNQIDDIDKNELGNNVSAVDSAKKAGCKVVLSLYNNSAASTSKFLKNNTAKNDLIKRSVKLMQQMGANGININFNGLDAQEKEYFVRFIASVYEATPRSSTLSITLPADDKGVAYDLVALDKYTNNFIIDFSKVTKTPGPLAPLDNGSNHSVETCFALYLDQGILSSKFILGVSYSGVVWKNKPESFLRYITYTDIRTEYPDATVIYGKDESSAHIEADYKPTYLDIWYDDEKTLGEKYDYALTNALGGIAFKSLGEDNGYGELQKVLATKFLKIDTAVVDTIIIKHTFIASLLEFGRLLVTNPCGQHIEPDYSNALALINIVLIVVLLAGAGVLFYQVKKNGEAWIWRRKMIYGLVGVFAVWTIFFLMWLFFWDQNPYFGPSDGKKNVGHCINISFIVLYVILTAGIGVGVLLRWAYQFSTSTDKP